MTTLPFAAMMRATIARSVGTPIGISADTTVASGFILQQVTAVSATQPTR